jgi:hypothetical protein
VPLPKVRPANAPIVVAMTLPSVQPAAAASVSAVPSANEVIRTRGYWVGLPAMNPTAAALAQVAALRADLPESTGSVADAASRGQRLAYAPQPEPRAAAVRPPARSVVMRSAEAATSIAVKAGNAMPLPVPSYDPWLSAVAMTPSVWTYLSSTQYGVRDFRTLRPFLDKPTRTVVMAFSEDPQDGLTAERFSGLAVVFVGTVTFAANAGESRTRTASLR